MAALRLDAAAGPVIARGAAPTRPDAAARTAADHLVQALADEGVRCLYGYPGGAALPVYDALARQACGPGDEPIAHLLVRHEQNAVHAADGHARASGEVGVCLFSSGPGVTNAVTGLATAHMDSVPLVVITGQVPSHALGQDAFQEVDAIGITRSCVKHSFMLTDPEQVEDTVRQAFHLARSGRPGPVLIDLPRDVSSARMSRPYRPGQLPARRRRDHRPLPHRQLARAALAISQASRPLIYHGGHRMQPCSQTSLHATASGALRSVAGASGTSRALRSACHLCFARSSPCLYAG